MAVLLTIYFIRYIWLTMVNELIAICTYVDFNYFITKTPIYNVIYYVLHFKVRSLRQRIYLNKRQRDVFYKGSYL